MEDFCLCLLKVNCNSNSANILRDWNPSSDPPLRLVAMESNSINEYFKFNKVEIPSKNTITGSVESLADSKRLRIARSLSP